MIERGKYYLLFTVDLKEQMVIKCKEKPEVNNMPLPEFFQEFLTKEELELTDPDYGFSFFQSFVNGNEIGDAATFLTKDENISYRFARHHKESSDLLIFSVFKQEKVSNDEAILNKDYLTGVYGRGAFTYLVNKKLEEETNSRRALFVIDLDNFKQVNDNFGHATGDACLREMAKKLSDVCSNELLGRYGGDEFLVFVDHADKRKVHDLCRAFMQLEYVLPTKLSKPIKVTCSIGVAYMDEVLTDLKKLFDQADKSLYKAKNVEKNCSCIYDSGLYLVQPNPNNKKSNSSHIKHKLQMIKEGNSWLFRDELKARRNINIGITIISTILFIMVVYFVAQNYSYYMDTKTEDQASSVMRDISGQASANISSNIDSWLGQLSIAESIMLEIDSSENYEYTLNNTLKVLEGKISFDEIGVLLDTGIIYFNSSSNYDISSEAIIGLALAGEQAVGNITLPQLGERVFFSIPYICNHDNIHDGVDAHIVGLVGLVKQSTFRDILYSESFQGRSYLAIIEEDGTKVVSSNNENDNQFNPVNVLDTFVKYCPQEIAIKVQNDIKKGNTDIVEITVSGTTYMAYYTKTEIEGWRILIMAPSEAIIDDIGDVFKNIRLITYSLLILMSIMLIVSVTIISQLLTKNLVLTYTDPITSNINEERFKIDAVKLIQRNKSSYAVLYIDISHFKYLNELLGTIVADKILLELFQLFQKNLTKNELVSHVFADRFILLLEYDTVERLNTRLNKLSEETTKYFNKDSISLKVTMGVYLLSGNKYDINSCIDRAHDAQKVAKTDFLNNLITFFDESMILNTLEEIEFESDAEVALLDNQFEIYYQLKRDIINDKWAGSEALVRWIHPKRGLVSPAKFVPLFEKTGFIIKLDLYVFRAVCKDLRKMINQGLPVFLTSFNLSRKHLFDDNFLDKFEEVLKEYDIPHELIEFEVTESMVFDDSVLLNKAVQKIHDLGCRCSIDDFGSGYSSLNVLKEFDFDTIKLDKVFFYGINGFDDKSKKIVSAITSLSHSLDKIVVAEGIETEEQVEFLKSIGCDQVQGYYYSKPIPYKEYLKKIK